MDESEVLLSGEFKRSNYWKAFDASELIKIKPEHTILAEAKDNEDTSGLKRSINLAELIGFGVACTVGSGIYALVGLGAAKAGPAVAISYLIGAISCVFTGLAYAEFASRIPVAGSAYTYVYTTFGELSAWLVGWNLTLEYAIGSAVVARSWMSYMAILLQQFGVSVPTWLSSINVGFWDIDLDICAAALILLCTVIVLFGVKESLQVNLALTALNVAILVFFLIAGSLQFKADNLTVLNGSFAPFGVGPVFAAAGMVFFAYLGFDMVSSLAEEVSNPQRDLPLGIIGSLGISGGLYIAVAVVLCGMLPFTVLSQSAPLTQAFIFHDMSWSAKTVAVAAVIGLGATTLTGLMGQPRIFYRMAKDGLLFPFFAGPGGTIPPIGAIVTGIVTGAIALLIPEDLLADAISIGTLTAFSFVDAAVVVVRTRSAAHPYRSSVLMLIYSLLIFAASLLYLKHWSMIAASVLGGLAVIPLAILCYEPQRAVPSLGKSFRCPLVPLFPCIGIAVNVNMMAGLSGSAWIRLGVWTVIGLLIYIFYGYHNSRLRNTSPPSQQE
jgi:APA family basic amino acid/polyamine antiporter